MEEEHTLKALIKSAGWTAIAEGNGENSPASFEKHPLVLGMV